MRLATVVQARMGSTRFPGKVMAPLQDRPMLAHVLDRAGAARCVGELVLATTVLREDDVIADFGRTMGALVVRGPAEDVLTRFVTAADITAADVIVRLTADCPLLDPRLLDRVVRRLVRDGVDYASNVEPPSYPDGYDVEAMTAECLRRLDQESVLPHEREHVSTRVLEHPDGFRQSRVVSRRDYSSIRLTVDVPADLERVDRLLQQLPGQVRFGLGAVVSAVAADPFLRLTDGLPQRNEAYLMQRARLHERRMNG